MERLRWLAGTCCGLGYSPILPGTCGALLAIPIYLAIVRGTDVRWHAPLVAVALGVSTAVTIALGPWAEVRFREKDSSRFVTDEIVGLLLVLLLFRLDSPWQTLLWAFPITRIIDIVKVPPARRLEKLPAGWGVVADDLLGALYAAGLLHLIKYLLPQLMS